MLFFDELLLLLPLNAEGRVGEHVIEGDPAALGIALERVSREAVAEPDVVGVLALDQHVGFADRPGLVVPVLAEQQRVGLGIQVANVFFRYRQHAAGAAGRIEDRLHDVAAPQILLR